MSSTDYYIGLISGTSIDGIDCALVEFEDKQPKLIDTHFKTIDPALRQDILQLCSNHDIDLKLYGNTDVAVGRVFAEAANELIKNVGIDKSSVCAIGSHGQTIYHQPFGNTPFTLQIGDPNSIAQLTGITTVADFRRRDMAAGGEAAPLAPLLHRNCFQSSNTDRVILNVGGIANITVLNRNGSCCAFDTGPANVLMDYWIEKNQQQAFDKNGDWAARGTVNKELLELLLGEDYFSQALPKSTGRELFNGAWLEEKLIKLGQKVEAVDVQATLLQLTVDSIVAEIHKTAEPTEVYVCGGGAHNNAFMANLQTSLTDCSVTSTSALGIDPDWVEAIAFAWMAKQTIEGHSIDTTAFTGARQAVVLGGVYKA